MQAAKASRLFSIRKRQTGRMNTIYMDPCDDQIRNLPLFSILSFYRRKLRGYLWTCLHDGP